MEITETVADDDQITASFARFTISSPSTLFCFSTNTHVSVLTLDPAHPADEPSSQPLPTTASTSLLRDGRKTLRKHHSDPMLAIDIQGDQTLSSLKTTVSGLVHRQYRDVSDQDSTSDMDEDYCNQSLWMKHRPWRTPSLSGRHRHRVLTKQRIHGKEKVRPGDLAHFGRMLEAESRRKTVRSHTLASMRGLAHQADPIHSIARASYYKHLLSSHFNPHDYRKKTKAKMYRGQCLAHMCFLDLAIL